MSDLLGSIWWMIVALGVLVTFHEFGHYWVARRCGVKVLRFSVGFGKPLWSRRDRHGTEFALAAIPLGGYVKMLDEAEGEVPASQRDQAFNRKSVWQRIAVVAAGPLANIVLSVALLWATVTLVVRVAPAERRPPGRVSFGGTLVVVAWFASSAVFAWYLTAVADYGSIFGALATVVVVLTYLYISTIAFLTGVQLDALVQERLRSTPS